jgi:hypothetical protein
MDKQNLLEFEKQIGRYNIDQFILIAVLGICVKLFKGGFIHHNLILLFNSPKKHTFSG